MSMLLNAIFQFLRGGLSSFAPEPPPQPSNDEEEVAAMFEAYMKALGDAAGGKPQRPRTPTTPFEALMARHATPEAEESTSAFIECMLSALNDLGEEIMAHVPTSKIATGIEREEDKDFNIFKGSIEWRLDEFEPIVYPISIGLLKDGFIYVADEQSYVITVKVAK